MGLSFGWRCWTSLACSKARKKICKKMRSICTIDRRLQRGQLQIPRGLPVDGAPSFEPIPVAQWAAKARTTESASFARCSLERQFRKPEQGQRLHCGTVPTPVSVGEKFSTSSNAYPA
jgi:hypothetical protein